MRLSGQGQRVNGGSALRLKSCYRYVRRSCELMDGCYEHHDNDILKVIAFAHLIKKIIKRAKNALSSAYSSSDAISSLFMSP